MSTTPILLRPPTPLAEAMAAAAEESGVSRQVWMLAVLEQAVLSESATGSAILHRADVHPDDVPLFTGSDIKP